MSTQNLKNVRVYVQEHQEELLKALEQYRTNQDCISVARFCREYYNKAVQKELQDFLQDKEAPKDEINPIVNEMISTSQALRIFQTKERLDPAYHKCQYIAQRFLGEQK